MLAKFLALPFVSSHLCLPKVEDVGELLFSSLGRNEEERTKEKNKNKFIEEFFPSPPHLLPSRIISESGTRRRNREIILPLINEPRDFIILFVKTGFLNPPSYLEINDFSNRFTVDDKP